MQPDTYLTVTEVAERLQFTPKTIYRYIRTGKLQAIPFGRNYRITEADLQKFASKKTAPMPQRSPRSQRERIARMMRAS
ncbi:helix-turn-helix domain-containing protein [Pseudarthrobacter phenanthrenivorans]|uniref:helix-turn-helix domain-containing protein n=1 Tax=Pseudarthrobacter phenanthrenivorans TaxID=361575 RepID=UPI00344E5140